jgi:hypothetical protein
MNRTGEIDELWLLLFAMACDIFGTEAEERRYSGHDDRTMDRSAARLPPVGRMR